MKEKIIEIIKSYFPKKEILESTDGFQLEDHINDMFVEGNVECRTYTAYYTISYSENKRKTSVYKIEVKGESEEPMLFVIEVSKNINKSTIKRMVSDIANIGNEQTVQIDSEGRKGLALVAFCAHTIEKEIEAIPTKTDEDKEISSNVVEGLRTIVRNYLTFKEAANGIDYLRKVIEGNTEPSTSFTREIVDLQSSYEEKNKSYLDFSRKEYEAHGDAAMIVRIENIVNKIGNAISKGDYEQTIETIEELANHAIIYASLKKFKI